MINNYTNINNYFRTPITEHKITTTYDAGNPDPCLGQTQTCGWVKLVNGTQCPLKFSFCVLGLLCFTEHYYIFT
jgi:hypothetical protein